MTQNVHVAQSYYIHASRRYGVPDLGREVAYCCSPSTSNNLKNRMRRCLDHWLNLKGPKLTPIAKKSRSPPRDTSIAMKHGTTPRTFLSLSSFHPSLPPSLCSTLTSTADIVIGSALRPSWTRPRRPVPRSAETIPRHARRSARTSCLPSLGPPAAARSPRAEAV